MTEITHNNLFHTQRLLYEWLCLSGKRSYETIRKNCLYLDEAYSLGYGSSSIWWLFYPLVKTGVVDYIGGDSYAVCPNISLERNGLILYSAPGGPCVGEDETPFVGLYISTEPESFPEAKTFDALSVLRTLPSVNRIVDNFPKSVQDLTGAQFYNHKSARGLTKELNDGVVRYFYIPEKVYEREVPSRISNPDAFNLAFCYSSAVNGEHTGHYREASHTLRVNNFGFPIILFRVLLVESMLNGFIPTVSDSTVSFEGISTRVTKELNRILCKTIVNE